MDSLFALRAALWAGQAPNVPAAVSESPRGIEGWADDLGIELTDKFASEFRFATVAEKKGRRAAMDQGEVAGWLLSQKIKMPLVFLSPKTHPIKLAVFYKSRALLASFRYRDQRSCFYRTGDIRHIPAFTKHTRCTMCSIAKD
jgi:hypothetical protein